MAEVCVAVHETQLDRFSEVLGVEVESVGMAKWGMEGYFLVEEATLADENVLASFRKHRIEYRLVFEGGV